MLKHLVLSYKLDSYLKTLFLSIVGYAGARIGKAVALALGTGLIALQVSSCVILFIIFIQSVYLTFIWFSIAPKKLIFNNLTARIKLP